MHISVKVATSLAQPGAEQIISISYYDNTSTNVSHIYFRKYSSCSGSVSDATFSIGNVLNDFFL